MKALGRYIYGCLNGNFEPYFIIHEDRKYDNSETRELKVPISEQSLQEMFVRGRFNAEKIHITVSKQLSSTTISLCLQNASYPVSSNSHLPISGFPRTLMTEDLTQSKSQVAGLQQLKGALIAFHRAFTPSPSCQDQRILHQTHTRRSQASKQHAKIIL